MTARRRAAVLLASAILGSLPARGADLQGEAALERGATPRDAVKVRGWALSTCAPVALTLDVDGEKLVSGTPFLAWPWVPERWRALAATRPAGFEATIDPGRFAPGTHRVTVRGSACGEERELGAFAFQSLPPTGAWAGAAALLLAFGALPASLGLLLARAVPAARRIGAARLAAPVAWGLAAAAILAGPRLAAWVVPPPGADSFAALAQWDGRHYLAIADHGWREPADAARLPVYPLLLRVLAFLPGPRLLTASLVNGVLFGLAVSLVRRMEPRDDGGVLVFAFWPAALFVAAVYTESAFLFLSAAFVVALRDRRAGLVALAGALAGLTRPGGFALSLFAAEAWRRGDRRTALAALSPAAALAAWLAWQARATEALPVVGAMRGFGRAMSWHPGRVFDGIHGALAAGGARPWLELGAGLVVLAAAVALFRRGRAAEAAYAASAVLLPLASGSVTSLGRYAFAAFPALVFLGSLARSRAFLAVVLVAEAAGLVGAALAFGRGAFVG